MTPYLDTGVIRTLSRKVVDVAIRGSNRRKCSFGNRMQKAVKLNTYSVNHFSSSRSMEAYIVLDLTKDIFNK